MISQNIIKQYEIKDMNEWNNVNADLIITDPPFGIKFNGKKGNYKRKRENIVDGYVEWDTTEYRDNIKNLLKVIERNLKPNGQALIFSGWNNSNIIHEEIIKTDSLFLRGKLYWIYNFAPFCKKRPSHNVYEIFWVTKSNIWTYNMKCNTEHCQKGEPNNSSLIFKREYVVNMVKYPTRLPFKLVQCLIEHYSNEGDLIFDPLAGSGMVGVVSYFLNRKFILGDLNPKGKIVFKSLIEYYKNKKNFIKPTLLSWW